MNLIPDETLIHEVPAWLAHHYRFLPLDRQTDGLRILIDDVEDLDRLDAVSRELKTRVIGIQASEAAILEGIKQYYGIGADTLEWLDEKRQEISPLLDGKIHSGETDLTNLSSDASLIKFVNQIIREAYLDRATDIHIEPLRELILQRVSTHQLRNEARNHGMKRLREDGWCRVRDGITTVEVILRVTQGDVN